MRWRRDISTAVLAAMLTLAATAPSAAAVSYDIVYVRQPRFGDNTNTTWPEVAHPASIDPGADLMLLHPDGSEELLVAGGVGAVTDPVRLLRRAVGLLQLFYDVRPQGYNSQRGLPWDGADIFRINLQTRAIEQLTFQRVHAQHRRRPLRRIQSGRPAGAVRPPRLRHPQPRRRRRWPAAASPSPATATASCRRAG